MKKGEHLNTDRPGLRPKRPSRREALAEGGMEPMTSPTDFKTEAELQAYLAQREAEALAEDAIPIPLNEIDQTGESLQNLQDELASLRRQLAVIKKQAGNTLKASAVRVDASAHEQLGSYPWAKLAGAMAGTFLIARLLRSLPFAAIATAAMPLIAAKLHASGRRTSR